MRSLSREDRLLLLDIEESIGRIVTWTAGKALHDFEEADMLRSAVLRELTVIGEAVKQLSEEARDERPEIPWRQIAGLRDVVVHSYFAIDPATIWDIAVTRLGELREAVAALLTYFAEDA
jgi:uncharacterized protein with HEPN domain